MQIRIGGRNKYTTGNGTQAFHNSRIAGHRRGNQGMLERIKV